MGFRPAHVLSPQELWIYHRGHGFRWWIESKNKSPRSEFPQREPTARRIGRAYERRAKERRGYERRAEGIQRVQAAIHPEGIISKLLQNFFSTATRPNSSFGLTESQKLSLGLHSAITPFFDNPEDHINTYSDERYRLSGDWRPPKLFCLREAPIGLCAAP